MKFLLCCVALFACASAWETIVQLAQGVEVPKDWVRTNRPVDYTETVKLHVALTRSNIDEFTKLYDLLVEPTSGKFAQWLSQDELTQMLAPPQANIDLVMTWLKSFGVTNTTLDVNKDYIHVSCSIQQAEKILGQQVHVYMNTKSGQTLLKAVAPISVPQDVAKAVDTIVGLSGFPVSRLHTVSKRKVGDPDLIEIVPEVLIRRYNVSTTQTANSKNRMAVAEFQGQYISQSDVCAFYKDYNLNGTCTISKIIGTNDGSEPGVESTLDVDYIDGLADTTPLDFYIAGGLDFCSDLLTWTSDISNNAEPGLVHSVSYGEQRHKRVCPQETQSRLDQDFMKLNARGLSFIIASGDSGSGWWARDGYNDGYLCPSWPATSPYVTSVGATYFYNGDENTEEAVTQFGSGGGFSFYESAPSYQQSAISAYLAKESSNIKGKYNAQGRGTPDVAAMGEEFTIVIHGGKEAGIGGTSAATPTFAGIIARLNDIRLNAGKTSLGGSLNNLIYSNPSMFYDVTIGSNKIGLNSAHGFECTEGWDPVTGMGTPNFPAMAKVIGALP